MFLKAAFSMPLLWKASFITCSSPWKRERKRSVTGKDYLNFSNNKGSFLISVPKCFVTMCTNEYDPALQHSNREKQPGKYKLSIETKTYFVE
jgi:hypothetical protein